MVVPDTLVRHPTPAPEWPLCAHSSCSNNTLHIYESGRDSTGEKSENWFLTLWLCSLVWHSKIKSHSLHCSDFSPEWQLCARTSCSNKILQSYKSCISEGAEIQLSFAIDFYRVAQDLSNTTPKNMWQTKFQCIRAHLVITQQWTNTILSNTSRGNMWGTVQQVLFATNVLWESQMSTSWRNTCNSTLNRSVLFVKRNSMPERTWKGTHRYMKCKGVKNVENGSAARKSTDRTDKPTKRKQMMTRRLTYLELI